LRHYKVFVIVALNVAIGVLAQGAPVSLLQETQSIECELSEASDFTAKFDRLLIDPKDTQLTLFKKGKVIAEFQQLRFLDSAILLSKGKMPQRGDIGLFHIFKNGDVVFTWGSLLELLEKNCEDKGASKLCRNEKITRFFWSPEKMELESRQENFLSDVEQYGIFANRGTFFFAVQTGRRALTLIDFGARIEIVAGDFYGLNCHYLK
jgi:hypothetical protein